jgi:hypothetical protein
LGSLARFAIEQDNSNTRHYLGRFTRRAKVVSKKIEMVDLSIKLWVALTEPETLVDFKKIALSIYK